MRDAPLPGLIPRVYVTINIHKHVWLVVWLTFFYFPINIGNLIIPIDELIFFRTGWPWPTNQHVFYWNIPKNHAAYSVLYHLPGKQFSGSSHETWPAGKSVKSSVKDFFHHRHHGFFMVKSIIHHQSPFLGPRFHDVAWTTPKQNESDHKMLGCQIQPVPFFVRWINMYLNIFSTIDENH